MTEEEWLKSNDPAEMLTILRGTGNNRRLLLLATTMLDRNNRVTGKDLQRQLIVERYADGQASLTHVRRLWGRNTVGGTWPERPFEWAEALVTGEGGAYEPHVLEATALRAIREIFGNPFRPVTIDPAWLTSDVRLLATGIYNDRAFDRMPILADALQDAGCDNDDILNHLRDATAVHVRGCWALDLILSKE